MEGNQSWSMFHWITVLTQVNVQIGSDLGTSPVNTKHYTLTKLPASQFCENCVTNPKYEYSYGIPAKVQTGIVLNPTLLLFWVLPRKTTVLSQILNKHIPRRFTTKHLFHRCWFSFSINQCTLLLYTISRPIYIALVDHFASVT